MTWFEDLTPYEYLRADGGLTSIPTLNIGWLERGQSYPTGAVTPAFVQRLGQLVAHASTRGTRGLHLCDLCPTADEESSAKGSAEIRAVGLDGTRYAAPTLVHHYVTAHGYQPPLAFVDAVMRVAALPWEVAESGNLCMSCGSPLALTASSNAAQGGAPVVLRTMHCEACGEDYRRSSPRK